MNEEMSLLMFNIVSVQSISSFYLPHSNNSIGDENEKDDERLDKGCDCPLPFFEPSQCLQNKETGEMVCVINSQCYLTSYLSILYT